MAQLSSLLLLFLLWGTEICVWRGVICSVLKCRYLIYLASYTVVCYYTTVLWWNKNIVLKSVNGCVYWVRCAAVSCSLLHEALFSPKNELGLTEMQERCFLKLLCNFLCSQCLSGHFWNYCLIKIIYKCKVNFSRNAIRYKVNAKMQIKTNDVVWWDVNYGLFRRGAIEFVSSLRYITVFLIVLYAMHAI